MNDKPHSSRRDFLKGRAAADALSHWANQPIAEATPSSQPAKIQVQISRAAMATEFQVILNSKQHVQGPDAAMEALDVIEELEDQLTIYRDHSEVSLLNARAANRPIPVEPGLFGLLETSLQLWRLTEGAFDITAGPLSRAWGFHRRRGQVPDDQSLHDALQSVGSEAILLDEQRGTVQFAAAREINLGAIGKGYALDRAADALDLQGVENFMLQGGKSSILTAGARHAEPGWSVGLMHPMKPNERLGQLMLCNQALGTSGCGHQFLHHEGRRLGHILDPRTGWPAEGVLSATVLAPTATEADALATAAYVLGPDDARRLLEPREDLAVVMVLPGPKAGGLELLTWGLMPDQWVAE